MGEMQNKIEALGERLLELLLGEPNLTEAMRAIGETAEQRGLVDSAPEIDPERPYQFVQDLWTDNPALPDLLNLRDGNLPNPDEIETPQEMFDLIP